MSLRIALRSYLPQAFGAVLAVASCSSESTLGPNGDKEDRLGDSCDLDANCGANLNLFCHERVCTGFRPAAAPHITGDFTPPAYFGSDVDKHGRDVDDSDKGIFGMHAVLLHTGRVLLFAGHGFTVSRYPLESISWDPASDTHTRQSYDTDIFCSHQTFLGNGDVLVAGGGALPLPLLQRRVTWRFDPSAETWTEVGPMEFPRWYPTLLTMPDGRALVASGQEDPIPMEIFDPAANEWRTLLGESPFLPELYPGLQILPNNPASAPANAVVLFNPKVGWDFASNDAALITVDVDNNDNVSMVAVAGPGFAHENGDITFHVDDSVTPASAVMRAIGGGIVDARGLSQTDNEGKRPENDVLEEIDLTNPDSATMRWTEMTPMHHVRANASAVTLPNGGIWVVGGQTGGQWNSELTSGEFQIQYVYETELYSPRTNSWTPTKAVMHPRQYHHTATLLPDGRVLVAAGQDPTKAGKTFGGKERDIRSYEIFSPPYLFDEDGGPSLRPEILSNVASMQYGQEYDFNVQLAEGNRPIESVVLITPNAETHHTTTGRFIKLKVEALSDQGSYRITGPSSNRVAPPTRYLMFAIDSEGVPSVAKFVRLLP